MAAGVAGCLVSVFSVVAAGVSSPTRPAILPDDGVSAGAVGAGRSGYPPPLTPHTLREDFFHGVSMGSRSMIVYGPMAVELGAGGVWFRRFLMRQYFRRYRGLARA